MKKFIFILSMLLFLNNTNKANAEAYYWQAAIVGLGVLNCKNVLDQTAGKQMMAKGMEEVFPNGITIDKTMTLSYCGCMIDYVQERVSAEEMINYLTSLDDNKKVTDLTKRTHEITIEGLNSCMKTKVNPYKEFKP